MDTVRHVHSLSYHRVAWSSLIDWNIVYTHILVYLQRKEHNMHLLCALFRVPHANRHFNSKRALIMCLTTCDYGILVRQARSSFTGV